MAAAAPAPPPPPPQTRPAMAAAASPEEGRRHRRLLRQEQRRRSEARARQAALWGRARSLCRRLRALQARQVERHVRQQLAGLARSVAAASPSSSPPPAAPPSPAVLGSELRRLAASATARLRAAQRACDSDATDSASLSSASSSAASSSSSASSSSCSSSDSESPEAPPPPPSERPLDPRRRLAEHQWAVERAAIICRWTWLQAQVTDLEYRIRQQTDVYKQLRANKGPVVLGDLQYESVKKQPSPLSSARKTKVLSSSPCHLKVPPGDKQCNLSPCCPSYLLPNAEKQNSRLAQSLRNLVCQNLTCTPINGSPEPPKACTSPHQVNGISNCFNPGSASNSQDGVDPDTILKKPKQLNSTLPATPSSLDSSCVAARIRPICRYGKRRLVRVSAVSHLSRKPQKPLNMKCNCEQPKSCILCDCKASVQTIDPETMSLEERVALLDSGFHPILSFSHGNPLHLHFAALLREGHRLSHKIKNLKTPSCGLKDLTNNICSSSLSASGSLLKGSTSHSLYGAGPQTHKPASLQHVSPLSLESIPTPHPNQIAGNFMAAGSSALPAKKKKVESSYDINNIVIPMSMAAATRVEKLQYKEILTPSWRMVNLEEVKTSREADSEVEDTSDEAYLNRHQKFEELERARWDSWAGTISHRRGNRSSNKADGRWMPQPGSPDTTYHNLNHAQCASSPTGSLSPELSGVLKPLLLKGRSRGSLSFSEDATLSVSEVDDNTQCVQPWELRTFPLSNMEHQALLHQSQFLGKQTSTVQQRDSGSSQGLRTNSINPSTSNPREPFKPGWQVQPDCSKQQEEFANQRGILPALINNR